jgi:4-amino-4-deoxy-L-arabinose transferase-like glycosyltransferase
MRTVERQPSAAALGASLLAARRRLLAPAQARRLALVGVALAILALCAFLHLYRLAETPGWDPQEGYNLDIAGNLAQGQLHLFALRSAFAQHPPLFYAQLVVCIHIFGYGIAAVRALAALYALLTCAALLAVGRRILGAGPALWAALAYTGAPIILANTRWGYTYSQLAFVGLACLGAAWEYLRTERRGWLLAASALAGLAACSDYAGVAWIAFVALLALRRGWRPALAAAGIGLGMLAIELLVCLALSPSVFLADFAATSGRAAGGNPLLQLVLLLVSYYHFVMLDAWLLLGIVGLFLAPRRTRGFLLGATALLGVVVLKVRDVGVSLHTAVPLLPLLALGLGLALDLGLRSLYAWSLEWLAHLRQRLGLAERRWASRAPRLGAALVAFLVVVAPVGLALASDAAGLATSFSTRQDAVLATPGDAQAVARYIAAHARPGDLVLASPEVAWLFDGPAARSGIEGTDLLQTLAQGGNAAAFYPAGLPAARWAYDVSLVRARYVVLDNLLRALAAPDEEPALVPLVRRVEGWPVAFTQGQYTVYEPPGSV